MASLYLLDILSQGNINHHSTYIFSITKTPSLGKLTYGLSIILSHHRKHLNCLDVLILAWNPLKHKKSFFVN